MSSRNTILNKLRGSRDKLAEYPPLAAHLPMVPMQSSALELLVPRFIEQAQRLGTIVHPVNSDHAARDQVLALVGSDLRVISWAFEYIPISGLGDRLVMADPRDASVRVGITGVDAALAATGSLVVSTTMGKPRSASLLPPVHIAVMRNSQIMPDLESWVALQRQSGIDAFRALSSVILISGPRRTADIAMQLTMGMHGPAELHLILLSDIETDTIRQQR